MFNDAYKLGKFYSYSLGRYCTKHINNQLKDFLGNSKKLEVLGIGYTFPFLKENISLIKKIFFLMPNEYNTSIKNLNKTTSLVDINNLPIQDLYFDRIIIAHTIEFSLNLEKFLNEIWRILNGEGKVLFIIPNKISFWSMVKNNPFGYGQPFSKSQILNILKDNNFEVKSIKYALYAPPTYNKYILNYFNSIEYFFMNCLFGFGGVIIIEAKKQIYGIQNVKSIQKKKHAKLISIPSRAMRVTNKEC